MPKKTETLIYFYVKTFKSLFDELKKIALDKYNEIEKLLELKASGLFVDTEFVITFANTGREHEKTLEFVEDCSWRWQRLYGHQVIWLESVIHNGRLPCSHKDVSFETACRDGEVFEAVVAKYGLPNGNFLHCTRELKENPIHSYIKSIGWDKGDYQTALGIRIDEPRRLKYSKTIQNKVYPLVDWHQDQPDKLYILDWWAEQDFDLGIPEHLGNCFGCFRKSQKKTLKVIRDEPELFANTMENDFGHIGLNKINGEHSDKPRTMYRQYHTCESLITLFKQTPVEYLRDDEPEHLNEGCASSCEPFAN